MNAGKMHKASPGELVLQNGRQAGARRPLGCPATFMGRNPGCDVRLNVDGVDPLHCLLVDTPDGLKLRDLNSVQGTHVNGVRVDDVLLQHGDLLKVGPFQFRIELTAEAPTAEGAEPSLEEHREALRVQAAAIAAQQAAVEEVEARLQQRRTDLQNQEEQLAAHLAEKQNQVQLWTEYTKAERETLRNEKLEHEKRLDKLEAELTQARENVSKDHQKLTQERDHIHQVYQRLRKRWQKQWSAEKEKYSKLAKKLQADELAVAERAKGLQTREAAHAEEVLRFNTERELGLRQLQDERHSIKADQERWRRRRSHEFLVLKGMHRRTDEAQIKLKQARQLLVEEKHAWDKQLDSLHKELHGINNRVVHQRERIQEQTGEIARLDAALLERRAHDNGEVTPPAAAPIDATPVPMAPADGDSRRDDLDRVAAELADQRVHLLEQYERLAEIQDAWQARRDSAAADLEALAQRLLTDEQALLQRAQQTSDVEASLQQRQQEIETVRQEIQIWRAQLRAREQTFEQEHQAQILGVQEKETLLQEQLAALGQLRQRWNQRRQQEVGQLRAGRASLDEDKKKTQDRQVALFAKGQQIEEEKRILAEKSLALEQYRQEVFFRAKDPAAQHRVERLRRRWLSQNAALIRNAKSETESARKELQRLEASRAEHHQAESSLTDMETTLADKQAMLEEREAVLKIRTERMDQEVGKLKDARHQNERRHLRLQDEVDLLAKEVYAEPDEPVEKAA